MLLADACADYANPVTHTVQEILALPTALESVTA